MVNIGLSEGGVERWDGLAVAYSHVFEWAGSLYMIYCGNYYGKDGIGFAKLKFE